jgi:hypothetical protein
VDTFKSNFVQHKKFVIFGASWLCAIVILGWQVGWSERTSNLLLQWPTFILLILNTLVLLWWIGNPIPRHIPIKGKPVNQMIGVFLIFLAACFLFLTPLLIGAQLLWFIPPLSIVVILILRKPVDRNEIRYALILSLVSAITAIWAGWITAFTPLLWSILQFVTVFTCCFAGWRLLAHSGLRLWGVGSSCVLSRNVIFAFRQFIVGAIIAIPWALGIVALSGARMETWVTSWWHPLIAIQPAISEEAWGRLLLVPLFYYLTRNIFPPRKAITLSLVIVGYWFAFLHTVGSPGAFVNTVFTGTIYVLPVSYLCLYRDLETAIGFHFCIDFVKYVAAYLLLSNA